ncbi:dimethylsulfonioproprionate lyase family protein [Pectobacterium punjabense]|uniref:dimethylsulfonioproprionate lyase family protein n=1 Tax=Pectobacterium punjabense TaxID=2108399 RepID=UPI0019698FA9|nr:dimethylsulfonioproprionate lyase family protein [Pectobacterium punjabense]MBN3134850.1 cupin domain-containing protein [Pectobacterium punjabense]MCE5382278.1 cupin domain-containing protein [Pectobacterium punjabense]
MSSSDGILERLLFTIHKRLVSIPITPQLCKGIAPIANSWPSEPEKNTRLSTSSPLPAVDYLERALKIGETSGDREICSMLRLVAPELRWNFDYTPHPEFPYLDENVAFTQFVGPDDLWVSSHLAIGLTLIAPETHYPAHYHPATEIYLPLAGTGLWAMGNGGYFPRQPGELIFHPSGVTHATQTQKEPVLALYIWHGDIRSPSEWQHE